MTFRHDINGLRAIAVISVVLFHFQVPGFSAGFLGVDVFFVISGFLMAGILLKRLDNNPSGGVIQLLWDFYLARARRILPALLVLVLVLLAVGWWLLPSADYRQLAVHSGFAVAFLSNIRFWQEAGYFDIASHEKWLLHTWSLSVEWQFYLILPLGLLFLWWLRPSRGVLLTGTAIAFIASLLFSLWATPRMPSAAFFWLPTRAWELLAGVLTYFLSDRIHATVPIQRGMEILGLSLIGVSLLLFNASTPWPGIAALLPVAGTALVLLATRETPAWAMHTSMRWLGQISYSLYLWHWPVFVVLVYVGWQHQPTAVIGGIVVSCLLAAASYYLVEQRSRFLLAGWGRLKATTVLSMLLAITIIPAVFIYANNGVAGRMPAHVEVIASEGLNTNPYRDECHGRIGDSGFPWCHFGGDEIRVVLVGDSHASMLLTAVRDALPDRSRDGMLAASYTSCQTLFDAHKTNPQLKCREFNQHLLNRLATLPSHVPVLVSNRLSAAALGDHRANEPTHGVPSFYFHDSPVSKVTPAFAERVTKSIVDSACTLAAERPVYWLRPLPEMPVDVPRWMARQGLIHGQSSDVVIRRADFDERHTLVNSALDQAVEQCGIHVLDPAPYLCDGQQCEGSRNGRPLYYDVHHLSEFGNRALVPLFESLFEREHAAISHH